MNDSNQIRDHLQVALDQLLAALIISGGDLGDDIPDTALDAALGVNPAVQTARQAFMEALRGIETSRTGDDRQGALLAVEAATNALVVQAVDAAYRVGLKVGRGMRR